MPSAAKRITKTAPSNVITLPAIKKGEHYAGICLGEDGKPSHHLILLPGEAEPANWQAQMDWAKSIGGDLPDRVESALLFATLRDEFKPEWYWTNEQRAAYADCAFGQDFDDGHQSFSHESYKYPVRAVRRSPI